MLVQIWWVGMCMSVDDQNKVVDDINSVSQRVAEILSVSQIDGQTFVSLFCIL